jgi:hypothetical protein
VACEVAGGGGDAATSGVIVNAVLLTERAPTAKKRPISVPCRPYLLAPNAVGHCADGIA